MTIPTWPNVLPAHAKFSGRRLLLYVAIAFVVLQLVGNASSQTLLSSRVASCQDEDLTYTQGSFISGEKPIHVEQYRPKEEVKYPAIIMVHGSGGVLTRDSTEMPTEDNFGEKSLACGGYFVLLVHYFDRSGIFSALDKKYIEQESGVWIDTLRDAVSYVSSLPEVDATRIALFGESLGGYLALALAMEDRRIKAVSEYAGGIRLRLGDDPQTLPPTLIQHSDADIVIPVDEALSLAKLLSDHKVKYRLTIYHGWSHYPSRESLKQVDISSLRFFDECLKSNNRKISTKQKPREAE